MTISLQSQVPVSQKVSGRINGAQSGRSQIDKREILVKGTWKTKREKEGSDGEDMKDMEEGSDRRKGSGVKIQYGRIRMINRSYPSFETSAISVQMI